MTVRVRFAPSPTGLMHIGGIRTALLNYLFARQKQGTFILRIEDTDAARDFDPRAKHIMSDLEWLDLAHDEGPITGGPYAPYFQSERSQYYQHQLNLLAQHNHIYRCFCTNEELEQKRQRAITLKQPPRYDRICLNLSTTIVQYNLQQGMPFIWRFKIASEGSVTLTDLAHGPMTFELKNFADFPLTRADGSFTFLFTNAVDDMLMQITHVLRGSDHLSNTANQALLYAAFNKELPLFWHLPIICNVSGKKLSKRDFGFNLEHLKEAGFVPEAINNYVAIIGASFKDEIMNLEQLTKTMNFKEIKAIGNIRYDIDKLRWVNHKWLQQYDPAHLAARALPFLTSAYPTIEQLDHTTFINLMQVIKSEMVTLMDAIPALHFYFYEPTISPEILQSHIAADQRTIIHNIIREITSLADQPAVLIKTAQESCKKHTIPVKVIFSALRLALTGSVKGPAIVDVITVLGTEKSKQRLGKFMLI